MAAVPLLDESRLLVEHGKKSPDLERGGVPPVGFQ